MFSSHEFTTLNKGYDLEPMTSLVDLDLAIVFIDLLARNHMFSQAIRGRHADTQWRFVKRRGPFTKYSSGSCTALMCENDGYQDSTCSCQCPFGFSGTFCEMLDTAGIGVDKGMCFIGTYYIYIYMQTCRSVIALRKVL